MKNFILGSIFILVSLPQVSFGATQTSFGSSTTSFINPQLTAFDQQQNAQSSAFYTQQAADRKAFIIANPGIIAKQDAQGKAYMAYRNSLSQKGPLGIVTPLPPPQSTLTADEAGVVAAFMAKQQSDKVNFITQQQQARNTFLSSLSGPGPSSSSSSSTTPTAP